MSVRGCCGLSCSDCPAFVARATGDDLLRRKTADEWSAMYGARIEPSDIDCVGCTSNGEPHFHHCGECDVRRCCTGRGLSICGSCGDYPGCGTIEEFLSMVPSARAALESAREEGRKRTGS